MPSSAPIRNRLLLALPRPDLEALRSRMTLVPLRKREVLQEANRPLRDGFFIERGAASMLSATRRDGTVEVAMVGRWGMVGVPIVLGTMRSPLRGLMQIPGDAFRISAADLRDALQFSPALRSILNRYVQALLIQQSQVSLCNARHRIEERLARWLLLVRDRIESDEIPVSHELVAQVLGVRRAGVTMTLAKLAESGAVERARGKILVKDAERLQGISCECYGIIKAEYFRILDPADRHKATAPLSS